MEGETPSTAIVVATPAPLAAAGATAQDLELVNLWLNGRGRNTQRAYRLDSGRLSPYAKKPLAMVPLMDLQAFAAHLGTLSLSPSSRLRILSSVKSLFAFG